MLHPVGDLQRRHWPDEPVWRINYAIRRAGVQPVCRAGRHLLYDPKDVPKIDAVLKDMARMVRPGDPRVSHLPASCEQR